MATIDDVQIEFRSRPTADGRSCTLTTDDEGPNATNVRVNQPNGVRNRPYRTADAIAVRNGNLYEVLQFTEYGVVDARPFVIRARPRSLAPDRPRTRSGSKRTAGSILAMVATFNEATKQTTLGGKLVGLEMPSSGRYQL